MAMRFLPLTDYLQVARASTTHVRNETGVIGEIAVNMPAFEFDDDGRALGLRIEGASANLLRHSANFTNAIWEKDAGVTVLAGAGTAPDGSETATRIDFAAGTGGIYQRVDNLASGATHAFAVWMRAVSGTAEITLGGINGASQHGVMLGERWQRVGFVEVASATSRYPKISTAISGAAASVLVWNAQLEAAPVASSDMVSNGIPAARNGDDVRLDLSDGWFMAGAGTLFFDLALPAAWSGIWRVMQLYSASLNDDHLDLGYDSAANQLRISLRKGGQQIIAQSLYGALVPGQRNLLALAFEDDDIAVATQNGVLKTAPGFALPRNFQTLGIGSYGGSGSQLNGYVRAISYWPGRLGDDRLVALCANGAG
ncbi:phage head spike fiber domain-containing protein [Thalassospira mesophila]|uniref:Uncharacterized protein n=1 Tax=Thalassospira mesophila TaxID=1293891 RepID=A0A1Y2L2T3_9PROT|nr:hypothetical protein [Thalassospira mesophila]OSQ39798.1 hypothetical protein TMES_07630 [Thalassospira mesophila]